MSHRVQLGIYQGNNVHGQPRWYAGVFGTYHSGVGLTKEEAINDALEWCKNRMGQSYEEVLEVEI